MSFLHTNPIYVEFYIQRHFLKPRICVLVMSVAASGIGYPTGLWWWLVLLARFISTFEQPRAFWTAVVMEVPPQGATRGRPFSFPGLVTATLGAGLLLISVNALQRAGMLLSLSSEREIFWWSALVLWHALYLSSILARAGYFVRLKPDTTSVPPSSG
jgi:hypothetical protein